MATNEQFTQISDPVQIREQVYDTMMGQLVPEYGLSWVEDIFVPGHPCYEEYCKMRDAYDRLCQRLGDREEDPDAEIMVDALLQYARIAALKMFDYGRLYERKHV